jgi:hypothetical protein
MSVIAKRLPMFEPEYRVGLRILMGRLGMGPALRVGVPAILKSLTVRFRVRGNGDAHEKTKVDIKNHFALLGALYREMERRYGREKTNVIMHDVLMGGGRRFFRGFSPLAPGEDLLDFVRIYKDFESHNIVFRVIEASKSRFEIVIHRCLIYESFRELGIPDLTRWMCDIAHDYFSSYHPAIGYVKDRMIARGADTCHEVFTWDASRGFHPHQRGQRYG